MFDNYKKYQNEIVKRLNNIEAGGGAESFLGSFDYVLDVREKNLNTLTTNSKVLSIKFNDNVPAIASGDTNSIIFNNGGTNEIKLLFDTGSTYRVRIEWGSNNADLISVMNIGYTDITNTFFKWDKATKTLTFLKDTTPVKFTNSGNINDTNKVNERIGKFIDDTLPEPKVIGDTAYILETKKAYVAIDDSTFHTYEQLANSSTNEATSLQLLLIDNTIQVPDATGGNNFVLDLSTSIGGDKTASFYPLGTRAGDGLMGVYQHGSNYTSMWKDNEWLSTRLLFEDNYIINKSTGADGPLKDYLNAAFKFYLGGDSTGLSLKWVEFDAGPVNKGTSLYANNYLDNEGHNAFIVYDLVDGWRILTHEDQIQAFRMGLENKTWKIEVDNPGEINIPYADSGSNIRFPSAVQPGDNLKNVPISFPPTSAFQVEDYDNNYISIMAFNSEIPANQFTMYWDLPIKAIGSYEGIWNGLNILCRINIPKNTTTAAMDHSGLYDNGSVYYFNVYDTNVNGYYSNSLENDFFIWNKNTLKLTWKVDMKFIKWIASAESRPTLHASFPQADTIRIGTSGAYVIDMSSTTRDIWFNTSPNSVIDLKYDDIGIIKPDSDSININNGKLEAKTQSPVTTDNLIATMLNIPASGDHGLAIWQCHEINNKNVDLVDWQFNELPVPTIDFETNSVGDTYSKTDRGMRLGDYAVLQDLDNRLQAFGFLRQLQGTTWGVFILFVYPEPLSVTADPIWIYDGGVTLDTEIVIEFVDIVASAGNLYDKTVRPPRVGEKVWCIDTGTKREFAVVTEGLFEDAVDQKLKLKIYAYDGW